jgi:hypothetical protein
VILILFYFIPVHFIESDSSIDSAFDGLTFDVAMGIFTSWNVNYFLKPTPWPLGGPGSVRV